MRYGFLLCGGTGEYIKILCINIWPYIVRRNRRIYQNIGYWDMALYCGKEQENISEYCVLRYGIMLWGGKGEFIGLLCIEIWHYTAELDRRNIRMLFIEIWQYTA
jgi:hypothetical protein